MSWNPPIIKSEIVDTLFSIGVGYKYEKSSTPKGLVRAFELDDGTKIKVNHMTSMEFDGKKFKSTHELKLALIDHFRSRI